MSPGSDFMSLGRYKTCGLQLFDVFERLLASIRGRSPRVGEYSVPNAGWVIMPFELARVCI